MTRCRPWGPRAGRRAAGLAVVAAVVSTMTGCSTTLSGTAAPAADVVVSSSIRPAPVTTNEPRPTPSTPNTRTSSAPALDQVVDLAGQVVAAHGRLASVTKSTRSRDPYSVDIFTSVQAEVGGRVHSKITFQPTTSSVFGIEEIRCLGDQNFITPIPYDIKVLADDAHPWAQTAAQPVEDAPDSEHLTSYFCDGGYPSSLDFDVEFLLYAKDVADLGMTDHGGEQVRQLTAEVPVADAYLIPGLSWVGDGGVPDDDAPTVQVQLLLGSDDLVRRLTSQVQVDGRELGVEIDYSGYDEPVQIDPPDPAQVAVR